MADGMSARTPRSRRFNAIQFRGPLPPRSETRFAMSESSSPSHATPSGRRVERLASWQWINALSLDAVAIGLLWQTVFTREFCRRPPDPAELVIIGLAIWIVYTADRLLDSIHLDCSKPHTIRHRIHRDHRRTLGLVLIAAVATAAAMTCLYATERQLRWGIVAIASVVSYVVAVQLPVVPQRWFPKELVAGMVYAFGISLPAWAAADSLDIRLLASTALTGLLFAGNCVVIALIETRYDREQDVDSAPIRHPSISLKLPVILVGLAMAVLVATSANLIPAQIGASLIASAFLLSSIAYPSDESQPIGKRLSSDPARVAIADLTLVVPLLIVSLCVAFDS